MRQKTVSVFLPRRFCSQPAARRSRPARFRAGPWPDSARESRRPCFICCCRARAGAGRWRTLLIGLAYAATLILFVLANKSTTSANAIFLQSTAPLYLLLLGPLVLREPIRKVDLAVISAVATGAILLLFGSEATAATAPNPGSGQSAGGRFGRDVGFDAHRVPMAREACRKITIRARRPLSRGTSSPSSSVCRWPSRRRSRLTDRHRGPALSRNLSDRARLRVADTVDA